MLDPSVIEKWEPSYIAWWLRAGGYNDVAQNVATNEINGVALLHLESDGWQELGANSAVRRAKILAHLCALQGEEIVVNLDEPLDRQISDAKASVNSVILSQACQDFQHDSLLPATKTLHQLMERLIAQNAKLVNVLSEQLIFLKRQGGALPPKSFEDLEQISREESLRKSPRSRVTNGTKSEAIESRHSISQTSSMMACAMQWGDAHEVRDLLKQAMQLRTMSLHSSQYPHQLPHLPNIMKLLLLFIGVLPKTRAVSWETRAYNVYCNLLFLAVTIVLLSYICGILTSIFVERELPIKNGALLNLQLFIIIPHWIVWRREFTTDGLSMSLMRQISERGFYMKFLERSSYVCWSGAFIAFAVTVILDNCFYLDGSRVGQILSRSDSETLRSFASPHLMFDKVAIALEAWWFAVGFSHVWLVHIVSHFHRHNLLCYAAAMIRSIEEREPTIDIVSALDKLELSVTHKLRSASTSWVRFVVIIAIMAMCGILVSVIVLLTLNLKVVDAIMFSAFSLFGTVCLMLLCFPLAAVAETHEYDVLRALNSPKVLQGAQRYFGQQILPHLHTLEWGFRFCGFVITSRKVLNVSLGLFVAVVAAVGKAIAVQTLVAHE